MSSGGALAGGAFLVVLVTSAGAGVYMLDAADELEAAADAALSDALRGLSVGWLEVHGAYATPENGTVHVVNVTVRLSGMMEEVALHDIAVENPDGTTGNLTLEEAIRDKDGSLEEGILNNGDLARISIPLDPGLQTRESVTLTLHHPAASPLSLELSTPRTMNGNLVELDTHVR